MQCVRSQLHLASRARALFRGSLRDLCRGHARLWLRAVLWLAQAAALGAAPAPLLVTRLAAVRCAFAPECHLTADFNQQSLLFFE